jgi:hypothetical protein
VGVRPPRPSLSGRTPVALHAGGLAETFKLAFVKKPLGEYTAELTTPGTTTAGGAMALQHVRLVPGEEGGRVLVVGNANVIQQTAELRSLEHVNALSLERWREPTKLEAEPYAAFLDEAQAVLEAYGLKVTRAPPPRASLASLMPSPTRSPVRWLLAGLAIGVLGTVPLMWLLLRGR